MTESERRVQHAERPRRRPAAAECCREEAAKQQAGQEREAPRSAGSHRAPLKVRVIEDEAARVLQAARHAQPAIRDEEQCQGDRRNDEAGERPVDRRKAVQDEGHTHAVYNASADA